MKTESNEDSSAMRTPRPRGGRVPRRIKLSTDMIPQAIRDEFTERIKHFTVALVGLKMVDGKVQATQLGCGTLVVARERPFVLTAAHVWKHVFGFEQVGITVRDGENRFSLPVSVLRAALTPVGKRPEWGPDLALVEVPSSLKRLIESQHKAFYNLDKRRPHAIRSAIDIRRGLWVLVGAPASVTSRKDDEMVLRALVGLTSIYRTYHKSGYDYRDCSVDLDEKQTVRDLGGVSGGGLWHVDLHHRRSTSSLVVQEVTLEGVAFYQTGWMQNRCRIRCHGRQSIYQRGFALLG